MYKQLPELSDIHTVAFDFDGVFTDNKVWVDKNGIESVRCDRGDGLAFDLVRAFEKSGKLKIDFFILSKEPNPVVLSRAKKLKLECHHGISDKLSFMEKYLKAQIPDSTNPFKGLIYFGNDLNDLPLMRRAGFGVAPSDAHPMVQTVANYVLEQRGGEGCVRTFVEQLLGIENMSEEKLDELISNC